MLINFRCGNFRSLRDEVTLSMVKGESRSHPNHVYKMGDVGILKMAAIFGPNASGKSNIFNALRFSRNIILREPERTYSSYYRLEPGYEIRPTLFEYEFTLNGCPYRYGFEIILNEDKIIGEWLYRISLKDDNDEPLFRRVDGNIIDGEMSGKEKEILTKNIKKYGGILTLTLCDLFRNKKKGYSVIEEAIKVLDWFQNDLIIIGVNNTLRTHYSYDKPELEELSRILRAFDVGISDIGFTEWIDDLWVNTSHSSGYREKAGINEKGLTEFMGAKGKDNDYDFEQGEELGSIIISPDATERWTKKKREMLVSKQGKNGIEMLRVDESDGTKRLFDLAPILIKDNSDKTYVVDELDRSLHPLVVYEFVKWFLEKQYSKPKQLITTTHQITLMDQELMRKDEIWFVEKKGDGHSELFSLEEYNERSDRKIDRSYLDGRYGAVPKVHLRREE